MTLFEPGRLAVKLAGRDAGQTCVIVDLLDETSVLIDGQTRRRKCNLKHLELLPQTIKIKKNASHKEVEAEFKKLGLEVLNTKPKEKKERPRKQRKEKLKEKKEERRKAEEEQKKEAEKAKETPAEPKPAEKEAKTEEKKEVKASSFEEAVERETKKEEKKE